VAAALAGFFGARVLGRTWLPPIAGAVAAGLLGAALTGQVQPSAFEWGPPAVTLVVPEFTLQAAVTLVVPLVVMVVSMGNVPGIGLLVQQGFRPPSDLITSAIGVMTVVNAFFGGHQATLQRVGTSILAGAEAGPAEQRYVSNLVASVGIVLLGLSATSAATLLGVLPLSLVATLAGLAILSTLIESLRQTVISELPLGAFFAFVIAASPLSVLGIGAAFWALVGGMLVSLITEPRALWKAVTGGREG
jgi:benzoate membrane transport protein